MTNRERDILLIISKNPFVSQNEIAEKLDISRSAVSAYLNTMYKKGMIEGRGYIISEEKYPLVIGPSHIDIRSVCSNLFSDGVYNSLRTQITYGGPVKNIAEYLVGLEIKPKAIFAIASDTFGHSFSGACERSGIDISGSVIVNDASSPVYIELVDDEMRLINASFATDNLSAYITPAHLQAQYEVLKNASSIVLHDSVPAKSAEYLLSFKSKARLILVSSNLDYTIAMAKNCYIFDVVVIPYYIACELASVQVVQAPNQFVGADKIQEVAQKLLLRKISTFYMFLNSTQLCYCDGEKIIVHTSRNSIVNDDTIFREYMTFRDIFAAMVTYCVENDIEGAQALELIASARNIVSSSTKYFARGVNFSIISEGVPKLSSKIETYLL